MRILKANTAVRLVVGPLCDKTTGLAKTGMTVTNMAMNMWHEHDDGSAPTKTIDAVSFTASGGNNDMAELAGGYYDIEITAAQTNITAGRCGFCIYDDDVILPYFEEWLIVPANVFDSIMGTDKLDVNAAELGGTTQTGNDVGADVNDILADTGTDGVLLSAGTGAKQISLSSGAVLLQATQTGVTIPTVTTVTNAPTGMALEATLTAIKGAGWTNQNLVNLAITITATSDNVDLTLADTNELQADLVNGGRLDLLVDAIKAKTDLIPAVPASVGSAMTLADDAITAAKFDESTAFPVKSADTGATQIARVGADSDTLKSLSDEIAAAKVVIDNIHDTDLPAVKAETALIVADTNELQTDWVNGGRLDLLLDGATAPTAASVADAVLDEAMSGHVAAGSLGKAVADILEDTGTTLPSSIAALGGLGTGSTAYTPNRAVDDVGNPLDGIDTWVNTSDTDPTLDIKARAYTGTNGLIASPFMLDPGNYYVWRQHNNWNFTNPESITVS